MTDIMSKECGPEFGHDRGTDTSHNRIEKPLYTFPKVSPCTWCARGELNNWCKMIVWEVLRARGAHAMLCAFCLVPILSIKVC
jgi:hypothetical protein